MTETKPVRISGPDDLIRAVPHLLGFHPEESMVFVGLDDGRLEVTARIDLAETDREMLVSVGRALQRGDCTSVITIVFTAAPGGAPFAPLISLAREVFDEHGLHGTDTMLVRDGRWWSYLCKDPECCTPEGHELVDAPGTFIPTSVYEGRAPAPSREARGSVLNRPAGLDDSRMMALISTVELPEEEQTKELVLNAARQSMGPDGRLPDISGAAEIAAALGMYPVRDAVWMAMDVEYDLGRELWLDLSRRLPAPYRAAPLFLFAWGTWRQGDGALASLAIDAALEADPTYSAADLLLQALTRGLNPARIPALDPDALLR